MKNQPVNSSRDKILTAVRKAQQRTAVVFDGYSTEEIYNTPLNLLADFKAELEAVAGQCVICNSPEELYNALATLVQERQIPFVYTADPDLAAAMKAAGIPVEQQAAKLMEAQASVTGCEALVARTGSVLVSSRPEIGRQIYAFSPVHIVIAHEDQLVDFPETALEHLQNNYNTQLPAAVSFVTGPSRTADIEKTLVLGAHGPKELIIFVQTSKAV